jgi:deoxyribodipyrimidine photo-lyase
MQITALRFEPTRTAALARLAAFLPSAGRTYAARRNEDLATSRDKVHVSLLSPYVRHRAVTEVEILAAVLSKHSASGAEKFIQEVCWRTYWKGWLEHRPAVWHSYCRDVASLLAEPQSTWEDGYRKALAGESGIECFDHWVMQLRSTGYMHNHARMWFASIWIFTLKLPWQLGADFFLSHLLDADPASNTLSWRWVAGLQTKGKAYLARPSNIAEYTNGRFRPSGLAAEAPALTESLNTTPQGWSPMLHTLDRPFILLSHAEDLHLESVTLAAARPAHVCHFNVPPAGAFKRVAPMVTAFKVALHLESTARAARHFGCTHSTVTAPTAEECAEQLAQACTQHHVKHVVAARAAMGEVADSLAALALPLRARNIQLLTIDRAWDANAWPHATKGFFQFKEFIPRLVQQSVPSGQGQLAFDGAS